ncbi:MAG TPA: VCBS repeat-containing protein [Kiritimatiellia bacterium]|nr:VCBS repeat-containing protein [Kiritimatiellia bacterium]HMP35531.1 VCBS repeat-containing protein [Kiritimatiellia bacterium]
MTGTVRSWLVLLAMAAWSTHALANNIRTHDYNGDRLADFALYLPSAGEWAVKVNNSSTPIYRQWGWDQSYPVPGDYNGDGRTDIAVHHPPTGEWFILNGSGGPSRKVIYGWKETIPVPADYDGDGITDIAVFHPKGGNWYIYESALKRNRVQNWGWDQVRPVPADYDGDGRADLAVYHPAEGMWYIAYSTGGSLKRNWGWDMAVPVPADYDADGKTDLAVVDPKIADWHILRSSTRTLQRFTFNIPDIIPVVSRYNADNFSDIAFFQPASGLWGIYQLGINVPRIEYWGGSSHRPAGNWLWTIYDKPRFEDPPPPGPPPGPSPNPGIPADALDVSNAKLLGTHKNVKPVNARVTRRLNSADIDGSNVRLNYETLNWPDNNSGIGSNIDGRVYIFWLENGQVTGGHFEWKRPGQTSKGLSNIEGGYLEGKKPPRGATVWFCLMNNVGDERTNVVQSRTPYP